MSYPPPPPPLVPENPPGVTRRQRAPIDNKRSILLSDEENRSIFEILGKGRQTLSTAVVQLLVPTPDQLRWYIKETGVLCLVRDTTKKSYFIQVFSLKTKSMVFRQEIYNQFEYLILQQNFITFEGDNSRVGINFADRVESADFKDVLDAKLESKRNRRNDRRSRLLDHQQFDTVQSSPANHSNHSASFQENTIVNGTPARTSPYTFPSKSSIAVVKLTKKKNKDKGKKPSLRKEDIGKPMDFRHVQHVGWDPDRGFDLDGVDSRMLGFFEKAGVSRTQLEDATTREFIYNFIEEYQAKGGEQPASLPPHNLPPARPPPPPMNIHSNQNNQIGPPPVPIRHSPLLQHGTKSPAPPPPPVRIVPLPPSSQSKPGVTTININGNGAPPPPPPPPPPAPMNFDQVDEGVGVNSQSKKSQPAPPPPQVDDERSALLKQIQRGVSLKKVEPESQKRSTGGLSDCLDQIKTGVDLKKTLVPPKIPQSAEELDGLAGALNRALAARSKAINPESSSSGEEDDDGFDEDEWE